MPGRLPDDRADRHLHVKFLRPVPVNDILFNTTTTFGYIASWSIGGMSVFTDFMNGCHTWFVWRDAQRDLLTNVLFKVN